MHALIPMDKVMEAAKDIKVAHNDLGGNFLLVRKIRLTSPALHWLAFYCDNKIIGTTSALLNMNFEDTRIGKVLVLYFNSIATILQLIAFMAETEGAWVTLHGNQVWSHVHVPNVESLNEHIVKKALDLFNTIDKVTPKSLLQRIKSHDDIQVSIDKVALEMIGLNHWKEKLDELYDAVAAELESMRRI